MPVFLQFLLSCIDRDERYDEYIYRVIPLFGWMRQEGGRQDQCVLGRPEGVHSRAVLSYLKDGLIP